MDIVTELAIKKANFSAVHLALVICTGREYADWEVNLYVLPAARMLVGLTRHTNRDNVRTLIADISSTMNMNVTMFEGDVEALLKSNFPGQVEVLTQIVTTTLKETPVVLNDITGDGIFVRYMIPSLVSKFGGGTKLSDKSRNQCIGLISDAIYNSKLLEEDRIILHQVAGEEVYK